MSSNSTFHEACTSLSKTTVAEGAPRAASKNESESKDEQDDEQSVKEPTKTFTF